jgi:thioesterase domain-containing protein
MAAEYIEQIRSVQKSGPYHLLGWSFGGIAAHEIAVQLQAEGERVGALIVMDGYPLRKETDPAPSCHGRAEIPDWMLAQRKGLYAAISDEEAAIIARVYRHIVGLACAHEPRSFDGDLLLIAAAGAGNDAENISAGTPWRPYVSGEIAESSLPCEHLDMARPDMLARVWDDIAKWLETRYSSGWDDGQQEVGRMLSACVQRDGAGVDVIGPVGGIVVREGAGSRERDR